MAKEGGNTLSLKLLMDKHSKKVPFVEAGKDFIDFLFHLMTLPSGTVIRQLKNHGMVGCVGNLYRSIESIDDVYMESAAYKEALLKPKSPSGGPSFPLLLPDSSPASKTYFKCSSTFHYCCPNIEDHLNTKCPNCGTCMTQQVVLLEAKPEYHPFKRVCEGGCDVHGDKRLGGQAFVNHIQHRSTQSLELSKRRRWTSA